MIRNALADDAAEQNVSDSIQTVKDRIQAGTIGDEDLKSISSVDADLDNALATIAHAKRCSNIVKIMLEAQRFGSAGETEPQAKP